MSQENSESFQLLLKDEMPFNYSIASPSVHADLNAPSLSKILDSDFNQKLDSQENLNLAN